MAAAPTARASALAVAAAEAVGADLPDVEILHRRSADVVLELDTAVAFTTDYSLPAPTFSTSSRGAPASARLATVRLARGESHSA